MELSRWRKAGACVAGAILIALAVAGCSNTPKPESSLAHAERELLRFLFHQPAWLESVVGDLDLTGLSGRAERLIGQALLKGLDEGKIGRAHV